MKPAAFQYHAPRTLDEALCVLGQVAPEDGRVLAGGQSLVPTMAFRMARPAHLVDINGIAELDVLAASAAGLTIGAGVRHAAFHTPVVDGPLGALLSDVVRHIAHYPIRTRGTFCGSIAHADPASEWCLAAVALDATIMARSARGIRTLAAADVFEGFMSTSLAEDELLTEVRLPLLPPDTRFGFYEFSRRAGDYAIAMSLVTFRMLDGVMADVRVGIGGAEGKPRRCSAAEAALSGQSPTEKALSDAGEAAAATLDPMEDAQSSAQYRRDLVRTVVRRALERAAA